MRKALSTLLGLCLLSVAQASAAQKQLLYCKKGDHSVSAFEMGALRSRPKAPASGLPVTTLDLKSGQQGDESVLSAGTIETLSNGQLSLRLGQAYDASEAFDPADCQLTTTRPLRQAAFDPLQAFSWVLRGSPPATREVYDEWTYKATLYFVTDMSDWDPTDPVAFQQKIKDGKIIPVQTTVLCAGDASLPAVQRCFKVRMLEKIIPVP